MKQLSLIQVLNRQLIQFVTEKSLFCPICNRLICFTSDYLYDAFVADKEDWSTYWIAGLVTHYRHNHIRYYDRSWQNSSYRRKNKEYHTYEQFKQVINNRAKRQLLRAFLKLGSFPRNLKFAILNSTKKLQYNDPDTLAFINKAFSILG